MRYFNDFLEHHQVKRAHWGVHNGPPYPLDRSISTGKRLKKVEHAPSRSSGNAEKDIRPKSVTSTISEESIRQAQEWMKTKNDLLGAPVSSMPASAKIGSSFISEFDSSFAEETHYDNSIIGEDININPAQIASDYGADTLKAVEGDPPRYLEDRAKECNSHFGDPGTTQNCTKCSAAMELMNRGYNVRAGRLTYPAASDAFSYWFNGAERKTFDYENAAEYFNDASTNSGAFSINYSDQEGNRIGGHSMYYTTTSDGEFMVADGQNGRCWKTRKSEGLDAHNVISDICNAYGADKSSFGITQLNNCEPNWEHLAEDSVITTSNDDNITWKKKETGERYGKY